MKGMFRISSFLCFLLITGLVQAQNGSEIKELMVDGIKVIYKQVPKEIISVRLFINGGTSNYSLAQQGIENFAFNLAVSGGTRSMDKTAFSTEIERLGTTIEGSSGIEYGQFNMLCIRPSWDKSWQLFADAILNPAFDEGQFTILKEQLVAEAKQAASDPDSRIAQAAMENIFKGMDYEKDPGGTETSLSALTREDVVNYYQKIVGKKRAMLVVVGNVDLNDLKRKISETLSKLPAGKEAPEVQQITWNQPSNMIENREIATNYIRGYMNSPKLSEKDGIPMMIAMDILHDRLWIEIRTKRGLSYAPAAFVPSSIIDNPYSVIYVSTTDPKQSIKVMVDEVSKLKREGFEESELINKKQTFLTEYLMQQETLGAQSASLGQSELKGGWEISDRFTELVNAVTLEDINRVIDKYSDVISWTYLGKESAITEEDFLQPGQTPKDAKIDAER